MQTIPLDPKFQMKSLHPVHAVPTAHTNTMPPPLAVAAPSVQQAARESTPVNTVSELDAMLIADPNTGAVNGLRFALLFNAGMALSGLVVWELWAMLAS